MVQMNPCTCPESAAVRLNLRCNGSCSMNRPVANRISHGISRSKTSLGVRYSSTAPRKPPARLGRTSHHTRESVPFSSRRYPHMLPRDPGHIASVLVALALIDVTPSQTSVGKDTSVPPPATELIAPATDAA